MIGDAPLSKHTGVPGWHTDAEADFLMQMARNLNADDLVIVSVGVEYGRCISEFWQATQGRNPRLFAVDLFPATHHLGDLEYIFAQNMQEIGAEVTMLKGDSALIGNNWQSSGFPPIDLLLIDAGHHYPQVKADIAAWLPHVKEGGTILFHDYAKAANAHSQHFEVKKAVDEVFELVLDGPDSIVYVYKGMEEVPENDLTVIKGIGPKFAEELNALEIYTFQQLVEADPTEIAEALGGRVNPTMVKTWQSEALDYL